MSPSNPDIYHSPVGRGLAVAWVNSYSGVVLKTPGATLLFDPVSLEVPEDASLDLIAVSHDHSDHWDPELVTGLRRRTGAAVAASPFLASRLSSLLSGGPPSPGSGQILPASLHGMPPGPPFAEEIPPAPLYESGGLGDLEEGSWGELLPGESREQLASEKIIALRPGEELEIGDVVLTALRCDHAARQPLAFLVRTADNLTVYLPGDSTPFPEMAPPGERRAPNAFPSPSKGDGQACPDPPPTDEGMGLRPPTAAASQPGTEGWSAVNVGRYQLTRPPDILLWMGTVLTDGAEIARLVRPKVLATYTINPPAAGARARSILTSLTPEVPFHSLARRQVFVYPLLP